MRDSALTADDGRFVNDEAEAADAAMTAALLASERQDFIDRAAIACLAAQPGMVVTAYNHAEALWAERERRRNA